jgi:DNA-binding CsgD family transcriptional regulator
MIADGAEITYHAINSYIKKIYDKLHVHSATEAVARALKERSV